MNPVNDRLAICRIMADIIRLLNASENDNDIIRYHETLHTFVDIALHNNYDIRGNNAQLDQWLVEVNQWTAFIPDPHPILAGLDGNHGGFIQWLNNHPFQQPIMAQEQLAWFENWYPRYHGDVDAETASYHAESGYNSQEDFPSDSENSEGSVEV